MPLRPGQTDLQVVASGGRDLRLVAKRTRKFPRKYTLVAKKKHFKADYSYEGNTHIFKYDI